MQEVAPAFEIPTAVYTIIITAIITTVLAVVAWFVARRSGLGDIQIAVKSEADRLVMLQRNRIELLETQVSELLKRVEALEEESKRDKRMIAKLRKVISDKAIEEVT